MLSRSDTCCSLKVLNDVTYELDGEEDTKQYRCEDNCVYKKIGDPDNKYCFASGEDDVKCRGKIYCSNK